MAEIAEDVKERARIMYYRGFTIAQIAKQLGMHYKTIETWRAREGWSDLRKTYERDTIEAVTREKAPLMAAISGLTLKGIIMGLENAVERNKEKPISISDVRAMSEVFATLDKIIKLDTGQSTENVSHLTVTLDDIKKAIVEDEFIDVVPVHEDKK